MRRLLCPLALFIALFVPMIYGQKTQDIPTPEYYGIYALSGGKLTDLTNPSKDTKAATINFGERAPVGEVIDKGLVSKAKSLTIMEFGRDVKFLFYLQASPGASPMNRASLLHITPLLYVRKVSVDTGWPNNVRRSGLENAWDAGAPTEVAGGATNEMTSEITLRIKPVPGRSDMVLSVPSEELAPGVYKWVYGYQQLGIGDSTVFYFAVGPVEKAQETKCVDASYSYGGLLFSKGTATACSGEATQPITSTTTESATKANTPPSHPIEEVMKELPCSSYQDCYKVASQAYQKNDFVTAQAGFRKAQGFEPNKSATSVSLGFADLRGQQYDKIEADWNRALSLGATLRLSVCHELKVSCEHGILSLSADTVSFATGKDDVVFSVPAKDVVAQSSGQPQNVPAYFFRIKAGDKSHGFYFLPWWDTCVEQPESTAPLCQGVGYPQQKAIAEYVMHVLQKLNSGTLVKKQ